MANRCGGQSWRTLGDGRILLQGGVAPTWQPGDRSFRNLQNSWNSWGRLIRRASRKHGIPASWILAFINAETGTWSDRPREQADCGPWSTVCRNTCCAGLMQVMVTPYPNYRTYGGYDSPEDMRDPWKAIDAGSAMLAKKLKPSQGELPALAASYNQGGVYCPGGRAHTCAPSAWGMCADPGYIERVVAGNNTAVSALGVNGTSVWTLLLLATAGGILAVGGAALGPKYFARYRSARK